MVGNVCKKIDVIVPKVIMGFAVNIVSFHRFLRFNSFDTINIYFISKMCDSLCEWW